MRFYRLAPGCRSPEPAADQLDGEVPLRAYQYCEPFLAANRVGWLLYPPTSFDLVWNGSAFLAKFPDIESWIKVDKLFLPDFLPEWERMAPADAVDMLPPFLEAFPERGVIQIWTGLLAQTPQGVSSWIRGPVNRRSSDVFSVIEAIVETDWWLGPLFSNLQFIKTDDPVHFDGDTPWLQLFNLPQALHQRRPVTTAEFLDPEDIDEAMWSRFRQTSDRRNSGAPGTYRATVRTRENAQRTNRPDQQRPAPASCPVHG